MRGALDFIAAKGCTHQHVTAIHLSVEGQELLPDGHGCEYISYKYLCVIFV